MKEGREELMWQMNAYLCYRVTCLLVQDASKIKPEDMNPYYQAQLRAYNEKQEATSEDLNMIASAFG